MNQNDFNPKRILCIAAHPDDNEFCFAGSLAKWIEQGAEVTYLICTDGSRGSREATDGMKLASVRSNEQKSACESLGVTNCIELGYKDGDLESSISDLRKDIVRAIRTHKPDTVMCLDPTFFYSTKYRYVNHIDHRASGIATLDAVYPMARDTLFYSDLSGNGLEPHEVEHLLMFNLNECNLKVDITDTFDKKVEAMICHISQVSDQAAATEFMRSIAHSMSEDTEFELAEGFSYVHLRTSNK